MDKVEKAVIELDGLWLNDFRRILVVSKSGKEYRCFDSVPDACWDFVCTYDEFMETRRRLENKPAWYEHEYDFVAQCRDGLWVGFYDGVTIEAANHIWYQGIYGGHTIQQGHVFGDWRQSLERRPEEGLKEGEDDFAIAWGRVVKALNKHAPGWMGDTGSGVDNAVSAIERLSGSKSTPEPQWVPGELPPVGSKCEVDIGSRNWVECEILAHTESPLESGEIVVVFKTEGKIDWYVKKFFRPIQSHRDKVIEAAMGCSPKDASAREKDMLYKFLECLFICEMLKLPEGE